MAVVVSLFASAAAPGRGFTTQVSPTLIAHFALRHGESARPRMAGWIDFARNLKGGGVPARVASRDGELESLQRVNTYLNRVRFLSDQEHWGAEDYWASPAETVSSDGGDCEDFAIAKYFLLKELGVPNERLRITYVMALRLQQAHMVLAYYSRAGDEPLVLDNIDDRVLPASQRRDLRPVYSFNDDDVQLAQGNRRENPLQIRAWRELLDKLDREATL